MKKLVAFIMVLFAALVVSLLTASVRAVVSASARATPGTARMGPIDVTGLDGHTKTACAAWIASSTPGAGTAASAPT